MTDLTITGSSSASYRTTAQKVRDLAKLPVTTDVDIPIELAHNITSDIAATGDTCLNENKLLLIETLLAAHFAGNTNPILSSKSIAGASASFEGAASGGFGFELTRYGQQAMILDCTDTLKSMNSKQIHQIGWLGTDE